MLKKDSVPPWLQTIEEHKSIGNVSPMEILILQFKMFALKFANSRVTTDNL